jgi:hypothetical protein
MCGSLKRTSEEDQDQDKKKKPHEAALMVGLNAVQKYYFCLSCSIWDPVKSAGIFVIIKAITSSVVIHMQLHVYSWTVWVKSNPILRSENRLQHISIQPDVASVVRHSNEA